MKRRGFKMSKYCLRNKGIKILLICLCIGVFLFVLCQNYFTKDDVDGNFTKPTIHVNGYVYGTTMNKSGDIDKDYTFYGCVKSTTKDMIAVPSHDLEVSQIIKDNIGYKVYISENKDFVAIFNEETQKYDYFEKLY